jgi:hypothetical protein
VNIFRITFCIRNSFSVTCRLFKTCYRCEDNIYTGHWELVLKGGVGISVVQNRDCKRVLVNKTEFLPLP